MNSIYQNQELSNTEIINNAETEKYSVITKKKLEYIQQKDEFDYLVSLINSLGKGQCTGILLYGPPGIGKTLMSISLANVFHASYYIIDGSPDIDRRDLEGNWELMKGDTKFNYGPLTLAIQDANTHGISFIIINEVNAIRESEQISLNSLLSENQINLISKGFEKHELNWNSRLIIVGTMNKGVVGINKLQEAFEDRFIVCPEINYPIRNKEIEIITEISGCNRKIAEIAVDAARQIRKLATQDYSITKIFSTRLIINFCILISKMPIEYLKHNIENVIINKLGENQEEKKSIAMILDGKMFEKKLTEVLLIEKDKNIDSNKKAVENMKESIKEYEKTCENPSIFRKNGEIMWKFLEWLWRNKKSIFQDYFRLTNEKLQEEYKKTTGNSHLYKGNISLSYIKWFYKIKPNELSDFMNKSFPVF